MQHILIRSLSVKKQNGSFLEFWMASPMVGGVQPLKFLSQTLKNHILAMPMVYLFHLIRVFINSLSNAQFVPTINGYKRVKGGEAHWAPDALTYGYDSRAACIRIISPPCVPQDSTRFEIRIPGADMNPYFALSAIFGLGLRGMEKRLALPGPPIGQLSLDGATGRKVRALFAILLYLGCDFVLGGAKDARLVGQSN